MGHLSANKRVLVDHNWFVMAVFFLFPFCITAVMFWGAYAQGYGPTEVFLMARHGLVKWWAAPAVILGSAVVVAICYPSIFRAIRNPVGIIWLRDGNIESILGHIFPIESISHIDVGMSNSGRYVDFHLRDGSVTRIVTLMAFPSKKRIETLIGLSEKTVESRLR